MSVRREPACWSWPVPPLRDLAVELEWMAAGEDPEDSVGLDWLEAAYVSAEELRFVEFHVGRRGGYEGGMPRCAVCGVVRDLMVNDHDHGTGMIRGLLCRACNTAEGRRVDPRSTAVLDGYRSRHPALILDVYLPYTGFGWVSGWPPGHLPVDGVPRRALPWPVAGASS